MAIPRGVTKEQGVVVIPPTPTPPTRVVEPAEKPTVPWWEFADEYPWEPETPAYPTMVPQEVSQAARESPEFWQPVPPTPLADPTVPRVAEAPEFPEAVDLDTGIFGGIRDIVHTRITAFRDAIDTQLSAGRSPIQAYTSTVLGAIGGALGEIFWGFSKKVKRSAGYLIYMDEQDPMTYSGAGVNSPYNILVGKYWLEHGQEEKLKEFPELHKYLLDYQAREVELGDDADIKIMEEQWPKSALVRYGELLSKGVESARTGESLDFNTMQTEAWQMSAGFGYSHMFYPDRKAEYERLVYEGVNPETAGMETQHVGVELVGEILIDPMSWVGIQSAATKGLVNVFSKTIGGSLGLMSRHVPGVSTVVDWMMDAAVRTKAHRWSLGLKDSLQWITKYTDDAEEALKILQNPAAWEQWADVPNYTQLMFRRAAEVLQESPKLGAEILNRGSRYGLTQEVIDAATAIAQGIGKKCFMEQAPEIYKVFEKFRNKNRIMRAIQTNNAFLVDYWLGLRPAWNVFNYVDNMLKTVIMGFNPFHAIDRYVLRYAKYAPGTATELIDYAEAGGKIGINAWDAYKAQGALALDSFDTLLPQAAYGRVQHALQPGLVEDVGRGVTKWANDPNVIKRFVGQVAQRGYAAGGRIEVAMRSRVYFQKFFTVLDDGWKALAQRPIGFEVPTTTSTTLEGLVRSDLQKLSEPTVEDIRMLKEKFAGAKRRDVRVVRLGQDPGFEVTGLDNKLVQNVRDQLDDIALAGRTTRADIKHVFDTAELALEHQRVTARLQTMRVFGDNLPDLEIETQRMWDVLFPMDKPALVDYAGSIDDLGLLRTRVQLETEKLVHEFTSEYGQKWAAAKATGDPTAFDEVWDFADDFWVNRHGKVYAEYYGAESELLTRIADKTDEILEAMGNPTRFPRTAIDQYLDGRRAQMELFKQKSGMTGLAATEWRRPISGTQKDRIIGGMNVSIDRMWQETFPATQDTVNTALTAMKQFFADTGIEAQAKGLSLADFGQNADQWVLGKKLSQSLDATDNQFDDMIREIKRWKTSTFRSRIKPIEKVPLHAADKKVLGTFFDDMESGLHTVISDAMEQAIETTNSLLFDYIETPNWMHLAGNLIPFTRWPSKNIPLWANILAKHPKLISSVAKIRQAQALMNRDLPTRLQYSVPLPNWMMGIPGSKLHQALGLTNTQLRINPWSFISLFQQLPGGTPWKEQQLANLFDEEEYGGDDELKQATDTMVEFANQLGFGLWPYEEYLLGMFGFLGKDWYPRDAYGTWNPVVSWAMSEVFGNPNIGDVDRFIRDKIPEFWNTLFGDTELAWQELNPDLMIDWLMGREMETLIMELPPLEQEQLSEMEPEALETYMNEQLLVARRKALSKKMITCLFGNLTGWYIQPVSEAEIQARLGRIQKRMRQEALGPGPQYREFERLWRDEHPWYGLTQRWRFAEFPWATTAAEAEAEKWDTLINDYESQWWDYNDEWKVKFEDTLAELAQTHPGEKALLRQIKSEMYDQREETRIRLNSEIQLDLETRMEAYIKAHPKDSKGIKLLEEGWEIPVYRQPHLTDAERDELGLADVPVEEMIDLKRGRASTTAKQLQMREAWETARDRNEGKLTKMVKIPGIKTAGGLQMDLAASENSRTDTEVWELRIGNVLRLLAEAAPAYEDFESGKEWWVAYQTYLASLSQEALKLSVVQEQIQVLVMQQGITSDEATEIVSGWYTQDELTEYWRANDTIWEALEEAYQLAYVTPADAIYQEEVKPLKEEDYTLYMAAKEAFFGQHAPIAARDLIIYVMQMYPDRFESGEWTQKMLEDAFDGILMPGIQDRWRYRSSGRSALQSHVYYYYNRLTAEEKRTVQQTFGTPFVEMFLTGREEELTPELLGGWIESLSGMFGESVDWHDIPGVDAESLKSGSLKEKRNQGLPYVGPFDVEEFELARNLNAKYWELRALGDEAYKELENDPLRKKWFATVPQSLFWDYYYESIPPGVPGKELRNNPLVGIILNKGIRYAVATRTDYERALQLMESWTMLNSDMLYDYPSEEYEEVRKLMNRFYDIPQEDKEARKAFRTANPLLEKYLTSPSETKIKKAAIAGGAKAKAGGRGVTTAKDTKTLWTNFRNLTGGSFRAAYVLLLRAWKGTLGDAGRSYLKKLYAKMGVSMSFENWLENLRAAASLYGIDRGRLPPSPQLPPRVTYGGSSRFARGYRKP